MRLVIRYLWNWRIWSTALVMVPFILIDTTFVAATLMNFFNGAWAPVVIGAVIVLLITTWHAWHVPSGTENAPDRSSAKFINREA